MIGNNLSDRKFIQIRRVLKIDDFTIKGSKKLKVHCLVTKNQFQTFINEININYVPIDNRDNIEFIIYEETSNKWGRLLKLISKDDNLNKDFSIDEGFNIIINGNKLYSYTELLKSEIIHKDNNVGKFIPAGLKYDGSMGYIEFFVLNPKDRKWYLFTSNEFEDVEIVKKAINNKKNNNHLTKHTLYPNEFLKVKTNAYYNRDYIKYDKQKEIDFINLLKNTFGTENLNVLINAKEEAIKIIKEDLQLIVEENNFQESSIVCVPRAFAKDKYFDNQLYFLKAVKEATNSLKNVKDATNSITRTISTKTTHLSKHDRIGDNYENYGSMPYPGITRETCSINKSQIYNKNIILVDDVYTPGVNIDEDAIQALYDLGAKNIIFYSVAKTKL